MKLVAAHVLVGLALVGCRGGEPVGDGQSAAEAKAVVVLAAASTTDAVEEIARRFEERGDVRVHVSVGPSSGLARQIVAGAPADLFLSAHPKWVDTLREAGLVERSRDRLTNRLALIVPAANPARIASPADLTLPSLSWVALAGEQVPAGIYADEALASFGLLRRLTEAGKIVRGHDVRFALGYVALGEAEAGIVYATDARLTESVKAVFTFPPESHSPVRYPVVLLERPSPVAEALFEFLLSNEAGAVFRDFEFTPLQMTGDRDSQE